MLSRFVVGMLSVGLMVLSAGVVSGQEPIPISALGLIDAHDHLPRGLTLDLLLQRMDEANVAKTVLMPVYYGGTNPQGQGISDENLVLEFYKKRPDRIIPFLGMQRPVLVDAARWLQPDQAAEDLLDFAESQLRAGFFRGMGEFILWHYPYSLPSGATGVAVNIPADTPLMKKFIDLASKYHVPVLLHYEIDTESFPALKRMLDYGRRTTVILAHNCGRPDAATLRALLDEYPNVFCDLGTMTHNNAYGQVSEPPIPGQWIVKNPIDDGTGHLRPQWTALYEAYADRFVGIGVDSAHPEAWANPNLYRNVIAVYRSMLSGLSPEAAEKIGFKNAERILEKPAATSTATATADCLFNWAERTHPQLFSPAASQSLTFPPYYYRYYSGTFNYLADSSADNHIWVLGPVSGNKLLDVAPVATFLNSAGCQ